MLCCAVLCFIVSSSPPNTHTLLDVQHTATTNNTSTTQQRVYQYAKDKETGKIKEEHVLGLFDPTATETAARRDALALAAASASASAAAAGGRGGAKHASVDAAKAWQAQWKLQQQQQQKQKEDSSQHRGSKGSAGGGGGDGDSVVPPAAPPMLELLDYLPDRGGWVHAGAWFVLLCVLECVSRWVLLLSECVLGVLCRMGKKP